jgi:hypothetical protein
MIAGQGAIGRRSVAVPAIFSARRRRNLANAGRSG